MSRVELNFVATGNFSQLKVQLDQVRRNVEQINKLSMGVGINSDQISRMKQMVAQYDKIVQSSGAFHRSVVQTQGVTEKFGQSLQNQTLKLGQYFQAIRTNSDKTGGSLRQLAEQQVRLSQSMMRTDPFVSGRVYVDTPRKINAISNATAIARKQQELYNLTLRNGANELIKWGKNTQWAGRQLSVGLTLPIMMFGKQASEVFIQFDKELVRMQKVYGSALTAASSGATQQIRKDMTGLASELAKGYGQSIEMTAGIGADLAATGLEGKKLIEGTRETSRLATLGEIDRQNAVKTTVALQNVFKLSTKELTESIDFLNAVENQSSLTLQDLTDAIPRAAPVVDELGGSYKDLAAMMAAMVEAGIPAAEAANAIKSSLASLINPTDETRKQLKGFGIDLVSLVDKTGGKPVETFKLLATEMGRLDDLSRARAIEQIFGKFQFARIAALLDNINTKGTQTARVFDLMGASSQQLSALSASELKALTESASGRYQRALADLQANLVPIGEKFTEFFTSVLEFVNKIFNYFNKNELLLNVFSNLAVGVAAFGPIIMTAGTLLGNFGGFLLKAFVSVKNLINGFGSFGKIATAETLAAANAAELFSDKMIQEAGSIDVVKAALQKLNTEMIHLIANQTRSAGISMVPAAAAQAQAAAQAAAASSAGRTGSGYLGSTSGQIASGVSRDVVTGYPGQFAHAVPQGQLTARGLTNALSMNPGTGLLLTGAAAGLQQAMNKNHMMVTLLMTDAEAELKRATIYAEQAGITLAEAEARILGHEADYRALYPTVTTLKSTMVRYSTMLEFVDKKLQTATADEKRRIEYAAREIQQGTVLGQGARVAKGTDILLSIATQTAGGARQFDAAMNKLVTELVAKGDITEAAITLATRNAQFTPSTSALSPLTSTTGRGKNAGGVGGFAAAYLGGKDMLTDPSEMNRTTQLRQERDRQIELIRQNNAEQQEINAKLQGNAAAIQANNAELNKATAQLQGLDTSRGNLIMKTQEEIAKMDRKSMGLSKDITILEIGTRAGTQYILAQEGMTQTLYSRKEGEKAIIVQNQEQMIINEQGQEVSAVKTKNQLLAVQAEKALIAEIEVLTGTSAVLAANEQELTLSLDQLSASSQAAAAGMASNKEELQKAGRMLTAAFNQQNIASEDRVRLMRNLDRQELESTEKVIIYNDRQGNSILSLIGSEQQLIASYDMASGRMVKTNAANDLETMAREKLTQTYQSEIAQESQLIAQKRRQLAFLDGQAALFAKDSAQGLRIQSAREAVIAAMEAHMATINSLSAAEAALEKERRKDVMRSSARVRASALKDINEKLSSDQLALSQKERSQILRGLTAQEMLSIEGVVAAQNRLGQQTIFLTNQVGETVIAYVADESGALRRAGAPPVPTGPSGGGGAGGGFGTFMRRPGVGMGAMGIGMAASMAGGAMGNSALMYGGMALSMAPMLAGLTAATGGILALVAGLGLLTFAFIKQEQNFQNFKKAGQESFTSSKIAAEHFGITIHQLASAEMTALVGVTDEATQSVEALAKAYSEAGDEATKNFINQIKNADPADAAQLLVQRYQSDIIAGFEDQQAREDIAALLKASGRNDIAFEVNLKIDEKNFSSSEDALKQRIAELQAVANNALTNADAAKKAGQFAGTPGKGGGGQAQIAPQVDVILKRSKEEVDSLSISIMDAFSTMPLENFGSAMRDVFNDYSALNQATAGQGEIMTEQFNSLVDQVEKVSPTLATAMIELGNEGDVSFSAISQAAGLAMRGVITDIETFRRAAKDPVYMDFIIRTYQNSQAVNDIAGRLAEDIANANSGTGSPDATDAGGSEDNRVGELKAQFAQEDKRKAEDDAIKSKYDKLAEAQDKVIERINKERDARRKLKEEQQANNDFMLTEMGLKKQINEALATGDLAGAALLQQQLANEQDKKAADDKEKRLTASEDKKISAAEREKKSIERRRDAEIKALEARRKAEDRAKQLSDAAKQSADAAAKSAAAQEKQQTEAGETAKTMLTQIQDKLKLVYFSTPEAALNDSLIAKLRDQLVDMGVPAEVANAYIAELWEKTTKGNFDSTKFDNLVETLSGVASAAQVAALANDVLARTAQGEDLQTAIGNAISSYLSANGIRSEGQATRTSELLRAALTGALDKNNPANRADGGPIYGPGGPKDDRIPAMLSNGEYVIQADSVGHYGTGFFDAVNAKKFATGGSVKGSGPGSINGRQDSSDLSTAAVFSRQSIRTYSSALARGLREIQNPTESWYRLCQKLARIIAGAEPFGLSALKAWQGTPSRHRHSGTPPGGSIAYWGTKDPGHAAWVIGKSSSGRTDIVSNDIRRKGKADRVSWSTINSEWGMPYLGWIDWTPSGTLPIQSGVTRPRPVQPPTPSRTTPRTTTPNPPPTRPRPAGVIPFAAATGTAKVTSDFSPSARNITSALNMGGMVMPKYHSGGRVAYAKGGEVAALLQSGETVLTGQLTDKLTPLLESIADGKMGMGDITNHIVINGANKSPEQIADIVISKINSTMSRQIRTNRVM
jgi:TP901 family phage tail tape measure protein